MVRCDFSLKKKKLTNKNGLYSPMESPFFEEAKLAHPN
jgi:hypothetical protein